MSNEIRTAYVGYGLCSLFLLIYGRVLSDFGFTPYNFDRISDNFDSISHHVWFSLTILLSNLRYFVTLKVALAYFNINEAAYTHIHS